MRQSIRALVLAAAALVALAGRATAQIDDTQDHSCDKAAKIVAKGHPAKKDQWALGVLVNCAGGAAVLASDWGPVPTDSTELFVLAASSRELSDVRILNASLAAVQNASLPQTTRRIAINVVLSQYAPTIVMGDAAWSHPDHSALPSSWTTIRSRVSNRSP